jgi:WD40 repeat protein
MHRLGIVALAAACLAGCTSPRLVIETSGPVECLAFSADGALVAAGVGKSVVVHDARDGRLVGTFPLEAEPEAVAFAPDGGELAAGSTGSKQLEVVTFDLKAPGAKPQRAMAPCGMLVQLALVWGAEGDLAAVVANDGEAQLVLLRGGQVAETVSLGPLPVASDGATGRRGLVVAAVSRDLSYIALGDMWVQSAPLRLLGRDGRVVSDLGPAKVNSIAFAPAGDVMAWWDHQAMALRARRLEGEAPGMTVPSAGVGEDEGVRWNVALSRIGRHAIAGGKGGDVGVYSTATGEEVATLGGHGKALGALACSPTEEVVATGDATCIRVWELPPTD